MFHNYLIIAWRNIQKNKLFSLINILGLALGMAACLLILEYVVFETSYDTFHTEGNRVYRVVVQSPEDETYVATASAPLGPLLKSRFPEIASVARFLYTSGVVRIAQAQAVYNEEKFAYVDEDFFQVFSYPLLTPQFPGLLSEPNTIVISQTYAKKYFGSEKAVGKTLTFYDQFGEHTCTVSAVLQDVPINSHLQFHALLSISTLNTTSQFWAKLSNWSWTSFYTYVQLTKEASPQLLADKFPGLIKQVGADEKSKLALQRMTGIHLYSNLPAEAGTNGNSKLVYFLTTIALFILLIAWVNYINLSTTRALDRAKEVGIRKVSGSSRPQLIGQFLLEALLLNLLAIVLAVTFVQLCQPLFNTLTGKPLSIALLHTHTLWLFLLLLFIVGAFLAGAYPAFILSSFKPAQVLKGSYSKNLRGASLRKALVVIQFAASVTILTGTFTIYSQLMYMRNKELGINLSQLLIIKAPSVQGDEKEFVKNVGVYKNEMKRYPAVSQVTASQSIPGRGYNWYSTGFRQQTRKADPTRKYNVFYVNSDFFEAYQIQLLAGRTFSSASPTDGENKEVIVNEIALKQLGFATPGEAINQPIYNGDTREGRIIGVVKAYHHESLKTTLEALIVFRSEWANYFTLRINSNEQAVQQIAATIANAKKQYQALFPGNPFEYFFLDDYFDQKYQADRQFGQVFGLFALLAIIVACLGLFGLASFTITQRTKEIGIRKVLGASEKGILLLLSKDFIKLVLIANLVAWPLTYLGMQQWLQNYPYRIELNAWLFILPALLILLLASLTISIQTIKTAKSNPVSSLRTE
ncbi:ABC transporter permease [Rhodocytophaga aerolata]|uniref:ABC transporter permease n=1 Tax=Rhodocytophaga aerolata TaxID=455078 RepID=A0ABT8R533_9BACT|nr:ABC transporter permease [Rhodocytophaga aerolata]MDO1447201.1 ABC transporter permease [Rhodocytophaga aerolata]